MVKIISVDKNSYAERCGLLKDDVLLSVNGNEINDVLDYRFYIMDKRLEISVLRNRNEMTFSLEKPEYSDIGLEFASYLMDEKKRCRNKCIFCFIDQNPKGMRETIYFKDDDERLSFLHGNYVTLTNLKESDIERIVKMRISPVNVSVHTTNPDLRVKMLNNRFAGECLKYLEILDKGGISLNLQFVLCRGINDGDELVRSLTDISKLEHIESVALVPSGLTGHREGLYPLVPYDKESADEVINIANRFRQEFYKERGMSFIYPSDEFFLLAEREVPDEDYYEGYPQIENGVGMIRSDTVEFLECLENFSDIDYNRRVTVATGEAAYDFICSLASRVTEKYKNVTVNVVAVKNNFFGGSVTVSGLVTGGDLVAQLSGKDLGDQVLIPENMLRAQGDLFLDNVSLEQVTELLNVPVKVVSKGGYALCEAMLGQETEN